MFGILTPAVKLARPTPNTRNLIPWHGDLFRLVNPREQPFASLMYVNELQTRAVVFTYLTNNRYLPSPSPIPVKLKGLDPKKSYKLNEINLYPGTSSALDSGGVFSGDFLMTVGFNPKLSARCASVVVELTEAQ